MKLEIHKNPDPILRQKTVKIKDPLAKDIQELVLNMLETMHKANGVGLAAPQIGLNLRLCVIDTDGEELVLINPQITSKSKNKTISEEGCLSFPNTFFPISRHSEVQVRYTDQFGNAKKVRGQGLLGRALQHEIDHLEGILITDRVSKNFLKKLQAEKK